MFFADLSGVTDADDALRPDHGRLVLRLGSYHKVLLVLVEVVQGVPRTKIGVLVDVLAGGGILEARISKCGTVCNFGLANN